LVKRVKEDRLEKEIWVNPEKKRVRKGEKWQRLFSPNYPFFPIKGGKRGREGREIGDLYYNSTQGGEGKK